MKKILLVSLIIFPFRLNLRAQDHQFDPPWNKPPESKVMFTIPGVDNIPDLYGDINDPQLVVFLQVISSWC